MKNSANHNILSAVGKDTSKPEQEDNPQLSRAVDLLRAGGLVAFPTETVYGLGADAANPAAVQRIFALKGRPADHPLIVHLAAAEQLREWAREIPAGAWQLAERYWPGPLTLILKKADWVPAAVTGGQDTIGLRVPAHHFALALLKDFGGGLAAPSANRFGRISPTRAEHVREEFAEGLDMVLDGGDCQVGLESTIISLIDECPELLRPGGISAGAIAETLGTPVVRPPSRPSGIKAPGMHSSHYAPFTPVEVQFRETLWERVKSMCERGMQVAIMAFSDSFPDKSSVLPAHTVVMPFEPYTYGKKLYATMRLLDRGGYDALLVEAPPSGDAWSAINNRLRRAAHPRIKQRRSVR